MTSQLSAPPSEPTRPDKQRTSGKETLANVTVTFALLGFLLLLSWNVILFVFAFLLGGIGCGDFYTYHWPCTALPWILALFTLLFTSGGSFFMFRHRYGLALFLMTLPSAIVFGISAAGGF
jgi:hypothetical protein